MGFEDYNHPFDEYDDNDDFFLLFYFQRNKKKMVSPSVVTKYTKDIGPYYTFYKQILFFRTKIGIPSLEYEEIIILEACSPSERVTMPVSYDPPPLFLLLPPPY